MSVSFTPQFRRNSQWSDNSNISGLALAESTATEKVDMEKVSNKLEKLDTSGKTLGGEEEEDSKNHRHLGHLHHQHDKKKKEAKKRRAEYRKEKCVIS